MRRSVGLGRLSAGYLTDMRGSLSLSLSLQFLRPLPILRLPLPVGSYLPLPVPAVLPLVGRGHYQFRHLPLRD